MNRRIKKKHEKKKKAQIKELNESFETRFLKFEKKLNDLYEKVKKDS